MRFLARLIALSILLLVVAPAQARPLTVLISIDGFRIDYLSRGRTPTLSALAAGGVTTAGMRPSFPSLTFPNHYALVTGLRPDRNGIVDNVMQDPARPGQTFTMAARDIANDRFWWDEATPIWLTAEKAGVRTATMFWPGSEVDIHGGRPTDYRPFDKTVDAHARVDQVLKWISRPPRTRPGLVTLYFDDVDTWGHAVGPDGAELNEALTRVDTEIGRLVAGLKARKLAANLIVVADHGMAEISPDRVVYLDDLAPADSFRALTTGPGIALFPAKGREAEVETALLGEHPHVTCWRKDAMPERFHYGRNVRVPPIICLGQTGWMIVTHAQSSRRVARIGGAHGFDPLDPAMAALFVANGPAFRRGVVLSGFDNVDIYPLLARLIGVRALPGDGNLAPLRPGLVSRR